MIKLAILLTKNHRLLSIAAMLDMFETVNRYGVEDTGSPFLGSGYTIALELKCFNIRIMKCFLFKKLRSRT